LLTGLAAQAHAAASELSLMQDDNQLIYSSQDNRIVALPQASGLFSAENKAKPSATAYMLPFVIKKQGGSYLFSGQFRFTPNGADQVTRPAQKGATYRALWTAPDGSASLAGREVRTP
jgi:hypothetical protein